MSTGNEAGEFRLNDPPDWAMAIDIAAPQMNTANSKTEAIFADLVSLIVCFPSS